MLQLEVYTKMLIFANNSSTKKKNFTPAPSNLDTLQEDREKLRAQIETQVRAEFERRLRDEVRVKVDEELKKHDGMHVHLRVWVCLCECVCVSVHVWESLRVQI